MSQPGADRAGWPPTQVEQRIKCVKNGGLGLTEVVCVVCGHGNAKMVEAIVGFATWLSAGDAIETDRSCPSLVQNGTLKTYHGFPHGMPTTQAATINADLLAWLTS